MCKFCANLHRVQTLCKTRSPGGFCAKVCKPWRWNSETRQGAKTSRPVKRQPRAGYGSGRTIPNGHRTANAKVHHCPPCWRRKSAACTLAQSYRHRRPILMKGNSPFAFQLPSVRRLTGNRASNCFSSMKPVSPSGFGQISTFI